MIVALPVCHKDEHLALQNLEWAHFLNNTIDYKCVITHDTKFNPDKVVDAARKCFKEVEAISYMPCPMPDKWPMPQNWAWQNAARLLSSQPDSWFWWEQDAIPLARGWVDKIDGFYKAGGKPFLGPIVDGGAYMAGVGVYPSNVFDYCYNVSIVRAQPFDIFAGKAFVKFAADASGIIIHKKKPHSFGNIKEIIDYPNHGAVIFHKCKDGSAIAVLKGETPTETDSSNSISGKVKNLISEQYDRMLGLLRRVRTHRETTAFIQLGRTGDILNIMPILKLYSRHGKQKPIVYVDKKYSNLITGTDYGKFQIWDGGIGDVQGAEHHAKSKYNNVFVPQLFGNGITISGKTDHFNKDHWLKCEMLDYFGTLPLEFNRRHYLREQEEVAKHRKTGKPMLLLALSGESSPFSDSRNLMADIARLYSEDFEIIDLCSIKLDNFYDFLGFYDDAALLITIDTAHLHLLNASHVPFIALLSDRGEWFQTAMTRRPVLSMPCNEAANRGREIFAGIERALESWKNNSAMQFFHVTERHGGASGDEYIRKLRAYQSWELQYNLGKMVPRHYWEYKRDARSIGDKRDLPFLKDVFESCLRDTNDNDVALFTNDDVWLKNGIIDRLRMKMIHVDFVTGSRLDVDSVNGIGYDKLPHYLGDLHHGRDIVAIKCGWLRKNFQMIPDYLLGASDWDIGILAMARWLRGFKTTTTNWDCVFAECELPRGWVFHEKHVAKWTDQNNLNTAPSQVYNRMLCKKWLKTHTGELAFTHLISH